MYVVLCAGLLLLVVLVLILQKRINVLEKQLDGCVDSTAHVAAEITCLMGRIESCNDKLIELENEVAEKPNESDNYAETLDKIFVEGLQGIMNYSMQNAFKRNEVGK